MNSVASSMGAYIRARMAVSASDSPVLGGATPIPDGISPTARSGCRVAHRSVVSAPMELPATMGRSMPSASSTASSSSARSGSCRPSGDTEECPWLTLSYAMTRQREENAASCRCHASAHDPKPCNNSNGWPAPASTTWTSVSPAVIQAICSPSLVHLPDPSAVLRKLVERYLGEVTRLLGQPEHALADDVALDLVGAAEDGQRLCPQGLGRDLHGRQPADLTRQLGSARAVVRVERAPGAEQVHAEVAVVAQDVRHQQLREVGDAGDVASGGPHRLVTLGGQPGERPEDVRLREALPDGGIGALAGLPGEVDVLLRRRGRLGPLHSRRGRPPHHV